MKPQSSRSLTTGLLTLALAAIVSWPTAADARRPVTRARHINLAGGIAPELHTHKEKFRVWREDIRGGKVYFSNDDHQVRLAYAGLNLKLAQLVIDDRLSDSDGFRFADEVEQVGIDAKAVSKRDKLTEQQRSEVLGKLKAIDAEVIKQTVPLPDSSIRTPDLNRAQIDARDIIRFGTESGALKSAEAASLSRKLDSLVSREASAKRNGKMSDSERERLFETARDLAIDIIDDFLD